MDASRKRQLYVYYRVALLSAGWFPPMARAARKRDARFADALMGLRELENEHARAYAQLHERFHGKRPFGYRLWLFVGWVFTLFRFPIPYDIMIILGADVVRASVDQLKLDLDRDDNPPELQRVLQRHLSDTRQSLQVMAPDGRPERGHTPEGRGVAVRTIFLTALRSQRYLLPVMEELIRLGLIVLLLVLLSVPAGWFLQGAITNGIIQGEPLTTLHTTALLLDPAEYVEVERLSDEARRALRWRVFWAIWLTSLWVVPLGFWLGVRFFTLVQKMNQHLRVDLLARVQAQSLRYHSESRVGDTIYRVYQDSSTVVGIMLHLLGRPISTTFSTAAAIAVIFLFDPRLSLAILFSVALSLWLVAKFTTPLQLGFREARRRNSAMTSRIQEILTGIKVIKAYGAEPAQQALLEADSRAAFHAAFAARSRLAGFQILAFVAAGTTLLVGEAMMVIWTDLQTPTFAAWLFASFGFTIWNLGAFSSGRARMASGVTAAEDGIRSWGRGQDALVAMDRVFDILDMEPEVADEADAVELPPLQREISFHDVSFRYQPERPVLENVSFTAEAGSITALVGPTGSGKTTITSLLLRLFDPDEGRIEVDGLDLRGVKVDSLRDNVSVALQENVLFGTTIRENIRYAVPDASDARVREAARVACADAFIEEQSEGYDTELGERGTKLSTGQRQRLSIARAVIKDTPVLILDEPTASLDAETELRVLERLSEWGRGRAIFLITHRLSTIRRADRIIYLRSGRIEEMGSHEELMGREGGAYRRFVELERAGRPPEPEEVAE